MKTILITGCSSGFGLETAKYFLERDWQVIATMRTPDLDLFPKSDRLRVLQLDVTDAGSIQRVIDAAGQIDVLVNNAGIGVINALEGMTMDLVREVFETNTFGTIAMTQAVLPQFRERKTGVVINITSSVTLRSLPLLSIYTASKAAVNAFTESLALEMAEFNVRVGLVLPGASRETSFSRNAQPRMKDGFPTAYIALGERVFAGLHSQTKVTHASVVAAAVWRAVNDPSAPMRIAAGADAEEWAAEAPTAFAAVWEAHSAR